MPGYIPSHNAMASKLITFYKENVDKPTHQAWIMLFEPTNGSLLAVSMIQEFVSYFSTKICILVENT